MTPAAASIDIEERRPRQMAFGARLSSGSNVTMDGPHVGTLTGSANQAGKEWQALRRLTVLTVDDTLADLRSTAQRPFRR